MNFFRSKQNDPLDQAISELRAEQPDAKTLSASAEHVWQKLQAGLGEEHATSCVTTHPWLRRYSRSCCPLFISKSCPPARALIVEDHLRECVSCRSYAHGRAVGGNTGVSWRMEPASRGFQWSFARLSFAAAALAVLVALVWAGRNWYVMGPPGNRAQIDSIAGQAFRVGPAW